MIQRLQQYSQSSKTYTTDPVLEQNQALRTLNQNVLKEAQVRAYNDVIFLNEIFAILLLFWGLFVISLNQYRSYKQQLLPNSS